MEINARKKNLVFEGVPESREGRENLNELICHILAEMGIEKQIEYDAVYRVGQKQGKHPRPLIVSFIRADDRNFIFSRRAHLRDSHNFQRVWLA